MAQGWPRCNDLRHPTADGSQLAGPGGQGDDIPPSVEPGSLSQSDVRPQAERRPVARTFGTSGRGSPGVD